MDGTRRRGGSVDGEPPVAEDTFGCNDRKAARDRDAIYPHDEPDFNSKVHNGFLYLTSAQSDQ